MAGCGSHTKALRRSRMKIAVAECTQHLALFEALPIGICCVSSQSRVLKCNRTVMSITGYSESEISHMQAQLLFPCADDYKLLLRMA